MDLTLVLCLILSSFCSFNEPSGLISSMPSSYSAFLPNRDGKLIFPFTTTNVVSVPLVWFLTVALNSPDTFSSFWSVLSLVLLAFREMSSYVLR